MTLKELKHRFETNEGLERKSVRQQIAEQLKRTCKKHGCNESLAFRRKDVLYCSRAHAKGYNFDPITKRKRMPVSQTAAYKRAKRRKHYNGPNGYKRKTIKKDVEFNLQTFAKGNALAYSGQTLLYENYKEPLKPVEESEGYGYYGTVALTEDKKHVQCHICGDLFENLGGHLRGHKIKGRDYKEKFGLALRTALVGEDVRRRRQELAVKPFNGELPAHLAEYNRKVQSGEIKHRVRGGDPLSLEKRNQLGLCPEQVLVKIRELADKLGHTPSEDEFKAHYSYRYLGSIRYQHGSYLKAVEKIGLKSAKELKEHTTEDLIKALQDFHQEHGRIPMTSDFSRGLLPSRNTYFYRFGSLNNARVEAGLNAVVPMPFGQIMELTPEQYAQYKSGHTEDILAPATFVRKRKREAQKRQEYATAISSWTYEEES